MKRFKTPNNHLINRYFFSGALLLAFAVPPVADAQVIGAGRSQSSVEIDLSVLDELGPGGLPATLIPDGLFPAPSPRSTAPAFRPPEPAPVQQSPRLLTPPAETPVVRPTSGPVVTTDRTPSGPGIKDPSRVRAPAQTALDANATAVAQPAKETARVRPPAETALEADAETPSAPAAPVAEVVAEGEAEGENAPPVLERVEIEQPATPEPDTAVTEAPATQLLEENEQVASVEPIAPPPEPESVGGEEARDTVVLPELSIAPDSAANTLQTDAATEAEQVEVEALAPSEALEEEPQVISGVAVPDRETLDALDQETEETALAGLPAVNTPSLARPEPTEPTEPTATSDTNDGVPAPATSTQVASAGDDEILRIIFDGIDAGVGPQGDALITGLSQRLTRDESLRLQIRAYAGGTPEAATQARRLSLDRALAVRSLLIDRGVRGTRIDIRALGDSAGDGPPDRVDIIVQ